MIRWLHQPLASQSPRNLGHNLEVWHFHKDGFNHRGSGLELCQLFQFRSWSEKICFSDNWKLNPQILDGMVSESEIRNPWEIDVGSITASSDVSNDVNFNLRIFSEL